MEPLKDNFGQAFPPEYNSDLYCNEGITEMDKPIESIIAKNEQNKDINPAGRDGGGGVDTFSRNFKLIRLSDIQFKAPDWLIKHLIEKDSLNLLFGDPASTKTFVAIDLGCCVATGKDFKGMPVKQGPVVYIAGEGQNGLKRRFEARGIRNDIN